FFAHRPPPSEEMVGDPVYYSPEMVRYINGSGTGSEVGVESDIFALGLLFSEYLTGRQPRWDRKRYRYACLAVCNGQPLDVEGLGLPREVTMLLGRMLDATASKRPSADRVHQVVKYLRTQVEGDGFRPGTEAEFARQMGITLTRRDSAVTGLRGSLAP